MGFAHKVDEAGFLIDPLPPLAAVPSWRGTLTPAKSTRVILPLVRGRAAEGGRGRLGRLFVQSLITVQDFLSFFDLKKCHRAGQPKLTRSAKC